VQERLVERLGAMPRGAAGVNASVSMPICPYPKQATYSGSGSITSESSYACN
jgi:hypothetical protein